MQPSRLSQEFLRFFCTITLSSMDRILEVCVIQNAQADKYAGTYQAHLDGLGFRGIPDKKAKCIVSDISVGNICT